jgi:uncharacterized protein YfkK (UPF0435 family)
VPRESPEGPADIRIRNLPSDVREKMRKLKQVNAVLGGPTDYKEMVVEALRYWFDSPENRAKLDLAERMTELLRERLGQLQQEAESHE